jgi:hypothetical protein
MYFPKSWSLTVLLAVILFAIGLFLLVYLQGGLSHSFLATH